MQDSEEQLLPILFDIPVEGKGVFMTAAQISDKLITYGNIKKPMHIAQLGKVLSKFGFQKIKSGKLRISGYMVYERTSDEIDANKQPINL